MFLGIGAQDLRLRNGLRTAEGLESGRKGGCSTRICLVSAPGMGTNMEENP